MSIAAFRGLRVPAFSYLSRADLRMRRGVAQPGRAPGSGPGGRRFKSSLPDQSFQALKLHFWFSVYIDGVEIVDGACITDFLDNIQWELQSNLLASILSDFPFNTRCTRFGRVPCEFTTYTSAHTSPRNRLKSRSAA